MLRARIGPRAPNRAQDPFGAHALLLVAQGLDYGASEGPRILNLGPYRGPGP